MALTQETILTFLLEHGGKVKNSELLNNFKSKINCSDPAEKQHNRDLFKKIVNSVAVVKQIDDVKFVVVKKRYQDFVKGGMHVDAQKSDLDDSFSSRNTSFSPTCSERSASLRRDSGKMLYSDIENNNMLYSPNINGKYFSDNTKHIPVHIGDLGGYSNAHRGRPLSSNINSGDTTTVKVLNISSDQTVKAGKTGAVFAVIAVKSPPNSPGDCVPVRQDGFNSKVPRQKPPEKPNMLAPEVPSPSGPAMTPYFSGSEQDARVSPWSKSKQVEIRAPSSPQLRKTQHKSTRQGDDVKYLESFPLEPMAHEWLVKSAAGLWSQIYGLLLQDAHLAKRKDFMSGFTALHWAAKGGNSEMVRKIMNVSKRRGTYVDVNSKAHGGYTPLHIAAIHGHDEVMFLLVQGYGAKVNIRDNDGKKPYHYLDKGVSAKVRELLGGPQLSQQDRTEDEDCRELLPKGLNTISRLFQPHTGHRKKQRHQQPGLSIACED